MPTTATVDMVVMADTVLATAMDTDMARGPLMPSPPLPLRPSLRLRLMPMPTTAMVDTALAMEATAMAVMATAMDTATARGQLTLMPMPTTAMVDMAATAMAVTALATAMDTAMARGLLMPMPTMAMVDMAATATAMAATATVDTPTESKKSKSISCNNTKNPTPNYLKLTYLNGQENYGCVSFKQRQRV